MPIITNFEEIKNYLEALTKIASGYHQILCEKCEHNGSEEWCWYCEQGFWYEFGAEHVECQNGTCQLCKKDALVTKISGRMAVLDQSNEPFYQIYTSENSMTKEIIKEQEFLLSLCYECRIKNGGVETCEVINVTSPP